MKLNKVILSKCRLFITLWTLAGCLLSLVFCTAYADTKYTIYFYNPETNINNYALLKREFDKYLSDYGNFEFQPFSNSDTFEKYAIVEPEGIFVVSSWYYKILSKKFSIEAALIGVLEGKSMHRKILSIKEQDITSADSLEDIINIDSLEGKVVTSSGNEEYTRSTLIQMLGEEKRGVIDSLKILTVPKDIDALMAVGFGIANLALTTKNSLIKLYGINPKQYNMIRTLVISDDILLPIVAVPKQSGKKTERLITIIKDMEMSLEGTRKLKMLGLDGWERLSKAERISLEEQ